MKFTDFFHLKPVQVFLLVVALAGVFLLGRCSQPEPVKEPIPVEQQVPSELPTEKKEPVQPESCSTLAEPEAEAEFSPVLIIETAEQEEIRFDEQCRDIQRDAQYCIFPFLPPAGGGTIICMAPEQKETFPQPVVLLKPLGKKKYIAPPEQKQALPLSVVSLKPLRTKKRIAPPGRSVQKFIPDVFDKDNGRVACEGGLIPALRTTVAFLESRSIRYGIGPLSDCSGIFHRVLQGVKKCCPDHAYPSLAQYRDSRDLARWYHERGELVLIKNAVKQSHIIRPGVVLFFGRNGSLYKNFSVNRLLASRGGIDHVGVVVRIHKDKAGRLVSYELFHGHGRRGETAASITRWHKRTPTRAGYPPFGNGRQQLVAVARLVSP
ncbi:MAG: hypothetical protein Q3M30_18195 [Candidatus Electrothrix sp. Rat3]|nr:hypothetical protein [Candidatus Electrothrix rattekaaiensis]